MPTRLLAVAAAVVLLVTAGCSSSGDDGRAAGSTTTAPSQESSTADETADAADTDSGTVWLCRPGMDDDPCLFDESITQIAVDGDQTVDHPEPATDPAIDCFYVYPTVSAQQGGVANLDVDPELIAVAHAQASRFSQVCRVFAPVYRQRTLTGIFGADISEEEAGLGYADVQDAWEDYLAHDNDGRGVILIGHSQGTGVLSRLIAEEIEPDGATRDLIVSAMLLGGSVTVPDGADVGGSFEHLPVCRADDQTGCVIAYSAFTGTPVDDAFFGRSTGEGDRVVCTNPADLAGGGPAELDAAFLTGESLLGSIEIGNAEVDTPWVGYPGLFTGECRSNDTHTWFEVTENRAGSHGGGPELSEPLGPTWGLHLVDVNIALGNLVDVARHQAAAYTGR